MFFFREREAFLRRAGAEHAVAFPGQRPIQRPAHGFFVVHDQDLFHLISPFTNRDPSFLHFHFLWGILQRKLDIESSLLACSAPVDSASMGLSHLTGQSQAQANTVRLAGDKWLKKPIGKMRRW